MTPEGPEMNVANPHTWVLLYSRTGDNNQALALAQSLGLPFETKRLNYNRLRKVGIYLGPSLLTLDRTREQLTQPWPKVVISIGRWSVPVARWIKAQSPSTKIIFLGNPRINPRHFDLVIATPDYLQPRAVNVARTLLPLSLARPPRPAVLPEPVWLQDLPHPRLLLLVGGSVKYWQLSAAYLESTLTGLLERARVQGGSVIVGGSPRTPNAFLKAARDRLAGVDHARVAPSQSGGLDELFEAADQIMVTGDSMAMITEAILTGKPVGVLPLELSNKGWRQLGFEPAIDGFRSRRRDLRRFWGELWTQGLAGTITHPRSSQVPSPAASAARLAKSFLGVTGTTPDSSHRAEPSDHPKDQYPLIARRKQSWISWSLGILSLAKGMARMGQEDIGAMSLAARDERTPWYVKLLAGAVSITAMSPIDLTPDFIPVFGYLDDLVLLSLGTWVAIRLIPPPLMAEFRARAVSVQRRAATQGAFAIAAIWLFAGAATAARVFQ